MIVTYDCQNIFIIQATGHSSHFLLVHWFTKDTEFSNSIYSFPSSNSLGVKLIPLIPPTQDYFSGSFTSTNPTNQTIFYNSSYTFEDSEDTKK
jgi:hypothetical protein